jgi:acetyl esterase/lipase
VCKRVQSFAGCLYSSAYASAVSTVRFSLQKVILAGDSAGGNLVMSVAITLGMQQKLRLPTALCAAYPCLSLGMTPSPSRLLSLMDPLLSFNALELCLSSYLPLSSKPTTTSSQLGDGCISEAALSPLRASDEQLRTLPTMMLAAASLDPLLDDSVSFVKRCDRAGVQCHYVVFDGLPHGFLSFNPLLKPVVDAVRQCSAWMKQFAAPPLLTDDV